MVEEETSRCGKGDSETNRQPNSDLHLPMSPGRCVVHLHSTAFDTVSLVSMSFRKK